MITKLGTVFAILLLSFLGLAVWAASSPKDETLPVPTDLFCEFKSVPADQNAIIEWRKAAAELAALDPREHDAIRFCYEPDAREPADSDMADLNRWLKKNRAALDLFTASLNKPKAQWPERDSSVRQPEMTALSQLIRARLFEADQLAEHGGFDEAARSLTDSLKLAQDGIEGDPYILQYVIAIGTRTLIQNAVLRFAARKAAPLPLLERLLAGLPSLNQETNIYDHVLRLEYMQEAVKKTDALKLAAAWGKPEVTNLFLLFYPQDCWRPLQVLLDPSLVALHPNPIDFKAELALSARHYRAYHTNSCSKWADRVDINGSDQEEIHSNILSDIQPLMDLVKDEPLPLSRRAVQKVRNAYLQLENPVGRILDCSSMTIAWDDSKVFRNRTEREATRTLLALLIFERRKGVLPAKLSDLVDENLLKSVPCDFFADVPLSYSRERRIVWSVGMDGSDDGGKAGKLLWGGEDAVWSIPELH